MIETLEMTLQRRSVSLVESLRSPRLIVGRRLAEVVEYLMLGGYHQHPEYRPHLAPLRTLLTGCRMLLTLKVDPTGQLRDTGVPV